MAEDTLLPDLSWLNSSEAEAIANSLATSFNIGIDLVGIERTGKGKDIVKGMAFADASAQSDAAALANREDGFVAFTFAGADAASDASAFAIRLNNRSKLKTVRGRDVVRGIAFANSLADASASTTATAVDDILHAGIIKRHTARGKVKAFSKAKTGALDSVDVSGGKGNDQFIFHSVFGDNVTLNGGAGFDELRLPGKVEKYTITVGSVQNQTLTIKRDGLSMTVQNIEQFHIGSQTASFSDFV